MDPLTAGEIKAAAAACKAKAAKEKLSQYLRFNAITVQVALFTQYFCHLRFRVVKWHRAGECIVSVHNGAVSRSAH